jgi:hypothetical protein
MDHSNIDGFEKPESINIKEIRYYYCYISRAYIGGFKKPQIKPTKENIQIRNCEILI